jgi:hypothetical protein
MIAAIILSLIAINVIVDSVTRNRKKQREFPVLLDAAQPLIYIFLLYEPGHISLRFVT